MMTAPWYIVSEDGGLLFDGFINGVNEFLWTFIKHLIMSYLHNFLFEILTILTRMNSAQLIIKLVTTTVFT
jgi:hypothetical protein